MTRLLTSLMGRLPVGWLQLTHNRARLAAAVAGVAFANVLVFVQLGIMGSMNNTILRGYEMLNADIMISADDANTMTEGANVARQWMFQARADPDVVQGADRRLDLQQLGYLAAILRGGAGPYGFPAFGYRPQDRHTHPARHRDPGLHPR